MDFEAAVRFAYANDWPFVFAITVSWDALLQAGEHNEGHCLGLGEWEREQHLRKELARCRPDKSLPFVAVWGRDVGAKLGAHNHMSLSWPSAELDRLVAILERVTGSQAEFVRQPYSTDVVARSGCGGWQINSIMGAGHKESSLQWASYIAEQHSKHPTAPVLKGKAFGVSKAIGKSAREAAEQPLEAGKIPSTHKGVRKPNAAPERLLAAE